MAPCIALVARRCKGPLQLQPPANGHMLAAMSVDLIKFSLFASLFLVAGCAGELAPGVAARPGDETVRPVARPGDQGIKPPENASTVEEFDTTTRAERIAALATRTTSSTELEIGHTVASLGNPTVPGFWLETPLVTVISPGRVVNVATGTSVAVELLPIAGPGSAGSRISLAAMRLLGVALTSLPELIVFSR